MKIPENPWNFMKIHENSIHSTPFGHAPQPLSEPLISLRYLRSQRGCGHGIPWSFMECHETSWCFMNFHGISWNSTDFHDFFSIPVFSQKRAIWMDFPCEYHMNYYCFSERRKPAWRRRSMVSLPFHCAKGQEWCGISWKSRKIHRISWFSRRARHPLRIPRKRQATLTSGKPPVSPKRSFPWNFHKFHQKVKMPRKMLFASKSGISQKKLDFHDFAISGPSKSSIFP